MGILKYINIIYNIIIKIEYLISIILLIILILFTFLSVILRFFNFPIVWSLDLILVIFAWFSFLSISKVVREESLLGVDFIFKIFPNNIKFYINIINNIIIILFLIIIIYSSIMITIKFNIQKIASIGVSYSIITIPLLLSSILMLISNLSSLLIKLKSINFKERNYE